MRTANERLDQLEEQVRSLKSEISAASAFAVNSVVVVLDELVDRRIIEAEVRTEILGRMRKDIAVYRGTADGIYFGASRAIPHYATKEEQAATKHRAALLRQEDERIRKEVLRPRSKPDHTDQ